MEYSKKQASDHTSEKSMLALMWDVRDLEELNSIGKKLRVEIVTLKQKLEKSAIDREHDNIARTVTHLREELAKFVKALTRHQRTAATHCLVLMISPEERKRKPYALPVQCLPYVSLKDREIRDISNKVIAEMHKHGMKVAGMLLSL